MFPYRDTGPVRPSLIGEKKIPLEELHMQTVKELAALPGRYSGPEREKATKIGRLFEDLTSNVAPLEFDRGTVERTRSAAEALAKLGPQGKAVLIYAMLVWSAPQIKASCYECLSELAQKGDADAREALRIMAERASNARSIIEVASNPTLKASTRTIQSANYLCVTPQDISALLGAFQGLKVGQVTDTLLQLMDDNLLKVVAVAQTNPTGRPIDLNARSEQVQRQRLESDYLNKDDDERRIIDAIDTREIEKQMAEQIKADLTLSLFVVPKCLDISASTIDQMQKELMAGVGLSPLPSLSECTLSEVCKLSEKIVRAWETKISAQLAINDITPEAFVDWQKRVYGVFNVEGRVISPKAEVVTAKDIKDFQRSLYATVRIGELVAQSSGGHKFEPRHYVKDPTVAGARAILEDVFKELRSGSEYGREIKALDCNSLSSWGSALAKHLRLKSEPQVPPSISFATSDLLDHVLVYEGSLEQNVQKAFWDDEWHFAKAEWRGIESVSRTAFKERFGPKYTLIGNATTDESSAVDLKGKKSVTIGTHVYLCSDIDKAVKAAETLARKGRLPQYVKD